MNANAHMIEADGPQIQTSEILGFLIKRFSEALLSDNPKVSFLLQGLGLVGLGTDEELLADYKGLSASPHLPPPEIIRRSVEIFQLALDRGLDNPPPQEPRDQPEEHHEPDEKFSKRILMNAAREGKIMEQESDYRFFRVFEMLAWIGLQFDREWLAEFEKVRAAFKNDPENLVKEEREILRDVLFKRRPSDRVRVSCE